MYQKDSFVVCTNLILTWFSLFDNVDVVLLLLLKFIAYVWPYYNKEAFADGKYMDKKYKGSKILFNAYLQFIDKKTTSLQNSYGIEMLT